MRTITTTHVIAALCGTMLSAQEAARPTLEALRAAPARQLAVSYRDVSWYLQALTLVGVGATVVLAGRTVTQDNVGAVKADLEQQRADLAMAIAERGYAVVAGRYSAEAAGCKRARSFWVGMIARGRVNFTIVQDSFAIQLFQDPRSRVMDVSVVVVDSAIAFRDPENSDYGFVGEITPEAIMVRPDVDRNLAAWPQRTPGGPPPSRRDLSNCVVRLTPRP